MPRRRRNRYKFTGKTHSKKAIITTIFSSLHLLVFTHVIRRAAESAEGLSLYYGSLGCILLVLSLAAVVFAIQSEREEESFKIFPHIATFLSVLVLVCWAGTYIWGLM